MTDTNLLFGGHAHWCKAVNGERQIEDCDCKPTAPAQAMTAEELARRILGDECQDEFEIFGATAVVRQRDKDRNAAARQSWEAERARLEAMTTVTMGVGDGSGKLFVHGDYESIKAVQAIVNERAVLVEENRKVNALWERDMAALDRGIAERTNLEITAASCAAKLLAMAAQCAVLVTEAASAAAKVREMEGWREHARLLLPLAKGYVAAHPGIQSIKDIVEHADRELNPEPDACPLCGNTEEHSHGVD